MDAIDDLVVENRELCDLLIEERNTHFWMQQDDMVVDSTMRATIGRMRFMLGVAAAVIMLLTAILFYNCSS